METQVLTEKQTGAPPKMFRRWTAYVHPTPLEWATKNRMPGLKNELHRIGARLDTRIILVGQTCRFACVALPIDEKLPGRAATPPYPVRVPSCAHRIATVGLPRHSVAKAEARVRDPQATWSANRTLSAEPARFPARQVSIRNPQSSGCLSASAVNPSIFIKIHQDLSGISIKKVFECRPRSTNYYTSQT